VDAAPGVVVGEIEFDGYFGKKLSMLVMQAGRIDELHVPEEDDSGQVMGSY
jgi:hypothetical protein